MKIRILKKDLVAINVGEMERRSRGVGGGFGAGMRPKKAYISKTTEPNLKNEYVLESASTGASTWR